MAFAQVAAVAISGEGGNTTTHTCTLPTGIVLGSLITIAYTFDGIPTVTFPGDPGDWVKAREISTGEVVVGYAYRKADGTEGSSITITTNDGENSAFIARRWTDHADPDTQAPEVSTGATGDSTAPDSDALTPTGGAKDYAWETVAGIDLRGDGNPTYPTNYTISQQLSRPSGTESAKCHTVSAIRELAASSEDPGTYTISDPLPWGALTVVIHPAGAAGVAILKVEDEGSQLSDTHIASLGMSKQEDEGSQVSEADLTFMGLVRTEDEGVEIGEENLKSLVLVRIENENTPIGELVLSFRDLVRLHSELTEQSELRLRTLGLVRINNDGLSLTETDLAFRNLVQVLTEATSLSETELFFRGLTQVQNEDNALTENVLFFLESAGIIHLVDETVELSSEGLRFKAITRPVSESMSVDELVIRLRSLGRIQEETVDLAEQTIRARNQLKQETEQEDMVESSTFIRGLAAKIINEATQLTEVVLHTAAVAVTGVLREWRRFLPGNRSYSPKDRRYNSQDRDYD